MLLVLGVSDGMNQASSWGWPVESTPKCTSVKGRLREAGVVVMVGEGWRTSCHWAWE